ncbi:MAG: glycosyltransferase [Methanomicrobiales archaeon]|nr:glycosyltransferase [Methanomicrobiales archaeon]MDI6877630.1 glycosyltransferase [Methanomicrobiales archaeon]
MKIGWIQSLRGGFGGLTYDSMAQRALSQHFDLEVVDGSLDHYTTARYPLLLLNLANLQGVKDLWIRPLMDSVIMMHHDKTVGKNLALVHHIDMSVRPFHFRIPGYLLEKIFYRNLFQADAICTVSKYWYNHFKKLGYENVHLIYNAFDFSQFEFTEEEIARFRMQYRLEGKPIIYLGNCQRAKGVVEAYQQLKDLDAFLVTSGKRDVDIPAINLDLSYRDYLRLLKASSVVVAMSKFKEGWCRTAHEALLCKTPVVGSGLGGMGELLEECHQIICPSFKELLNAVEYIMENHYLGEVGFKPASAKTYSIDNFSKNWVKVINDITNPITSLVICPPRGEGGHE